MAANLACLQNALNKVVDEVSTNTLDAFVEYAVSHSETEENLRAILTDFKETHHTPSVFHFASKKREKKTRPPNSYNMFIREQMREIKQANPELKGKELMKRATAEWNRQKAATASTTSSDE